MISKISKLIACGLCSLSIAVSAHAQGRVTVDNVFFQTDLRMALEDIAAQTGVNIVADPGVQGVVTVTIQDASIEAALDLLLAGTNYRSVRRADYFLVFTPDPRADLFAEVSETRMISLSGLEAAAARDLLVEPLRKYVRADNENRRLVVTAPPDLVELIVRDIETIDRPRLDETVFYALTYVSATGARDLLPDGLQSYVRADQVRNSLSITAPPAVRQELLQLLRRLDQPLPPTNVDGRDVFDTGILELNYVTAEAVTNLLPENLSQFVRADKVSNTVSIHAPPAIAQQIHSDIARIDQPRQHIMLEARVVVLDTTAFLNLGTNFDAPGLRAGLNRTEGGTDISEIALGYTSSRSFTNALGLTLNLLSQNNQASIISSPQVLAQDGIESVIRVTTAEFFQILTEDDSFIRSDLEEIETGTILRITPRLGRDGTLTLNMELEVSDVVARGNQNLPVVNRRTVQNTVQIENGGTAAVAGLSDLRNQQGRSGIPGLRNLPLFGRTNTMESRTRQLAIFITGTLVDPDERRFRTGNADPVPLGTVDEDLFRAELAASIERLGYR
ncbi:Type II secretory pathway component GspD/PulD (secretin) [Jannaschia seohaensis]|uniref:Type II secretory pathway component GspD/PulD (Secretin) n=1 Tax=Jannaschia seohaensis TaxID=475081 RepID=A0A2Y9AI16_9RHOB|nr:type II secretory pathway component GspD/PulD (secretin) [Jannaschia seohaensis]SSA42017.1 Type II secretory pathway component GspD/PulD (secretin) [Jannaschia seohaensis]